MARMKIDRKDRPLVKLQCFRLLSRLRIDPARSRLIGTFVESYLELQGHELKRYSTALEASPEPERHDIMEMMNSWERRGFEGGLHEGLSQGRQEGRLEGLREGVKLALSLQFGSQAEPYLPRLEGLDLVGLQALEQGLLQRLPLRQLFD